jgi:hypothetical protein
MRRQFATVKSLQLTLLVGAHIQPSHLKLEQKVPRQFIYPVYRLPAAPFLNQLLREPLQIKHLLRNTSNLTPSSD